MTNSTRLERFTRSSLRVIIENDKRTGTRPSDSEIINRAFNMAKDLDEKCSAEEAERLQETKRR